MSYSYLKITNTINLSENGNEYYQYFLIDASAGHLSITLPEGYDGLSYIFNRIDTSSNNVNIYACGQNQTINGSASVLFPIKRWCECIQDANNWYFPIISYN